MCRNKLVVPVFVRLLDLVDYFVGELIWRKFGGVGAFLKFFDYFFDFGGHLG